MRRPFLIDGGVLDLERVRRWHHRRRLARIPLRVVCLVRGHRLGFEVFRSDGTLRRASCGRCWRDYTP